MPIINNMSHQALRVFFAYWEKKLVSAIERNDLDTINKAHTYLKEINKKLYESKTNPK